MPPLKRVKRANVYDLYRTCKQAGTCPPDVIPKVEGKTVADKILQYGSMGVYLGGLGIGTGTGRPSTGGYIPLRGGGSTSSGSRLSLSSKPFAGGIPLETLDAVGAFRPSIIEDAGPIIEGVLPDAPAVIVPETVPVDEGVSGLDVSREVSQETLVTFLEPGGPDDIAVLDLRPSEHAQQHVMHTSSYENPLFHAPVRQASVIADTSGAENIFVSGNGLGSQGEEAIELTLFTEPRSSTPDLQLPGKRGIWNWFSKRYYTQVPVQDPDEIAAAGSYVFENPLYDSKAYKPEQQPDAIATTAPDPEDTFRSAARLLQGPSGRVGVSRITRPTSLGTRSGIRVGPLYHLRHSFSTIEEPVSLELIPSVVEETEVINTVAESHLGAEGYETVDLESIDSDTPLLEPDNHHISFGGGGRRRLIVPVNKGQGIGVAALVNNGTVSWNVDIDDGEEVNGNGGQDTTPSIVIDGDISLTDLNYRQYFLHPSLMKGKRRKKRVSG
ncbi:minor capsid protein [Deltapapillomavirus 5]|uniref:Minor capsid protein L2 n=1 Tax=Deltapapillomavirus 5 TaxID=1175853 RepID=A0A0S2KPP7_9PAPI|nr:minor capsid protein [Deltapapillomavirus 5]